MTDSGKSRRRRRSVVAVAACLLAGAALGTGLRLSGSGTSEVELAKGVPTELSAAQLRSYATGLGRDVYWLGPLSGRRLEVTRTGTNGVVVRYLPEDRHGVADAGSITAIATYPLEGAYSTALRSGRLAGSTSRVLASGGVAVWRASSPASVYVAYPGGDNLVEIVAPGGLVPRRLERAERARPVATADDRLAHTG